MPHTEEQIKTLHNLALLTEIRRTNELLKAIADKNIVIPDKVEASLPGIDTITLKGEVGPTGPPGNEGKTPVKGKDYFTSEEVEELKKAVRPVKGVDYFDGEDGLNGINPDPSDIVPLVLEQLPSPPPPPPPIDVEALVEQVIERVAEKLPVKSEGIVQKVFGGGHIQKTYRYDLTSQCDGVTKTFKVPLNFGILGVFSTQAPMIYRPVIDYTEGHKTLTLTSEVGAPQTGQTLWIQYLR